MDPAASSMFWLSGGGQGEKLLWLRFIFEMANNPPIDLSQESKGSSHAMNKQKHGLF